MGSALLIQRDVEALAGLAVYWPTVGANAHVCAPRACAQLLAHMDPRVNPFGVWR